MGKVNVDIFEKYDLEVIKAALENGIYLFERMGVGKERSEIYKGVLAKVDVAIKEVNDGEG